MRKELFLTEDGSHSIKIPELNVSYHSRYGAIQESQHIFINTGLKYINKKEISILEVGFGTGLNALLTLIDAEKNDLKIIYEAVELHPLENSFTSSFNYLSLLRAPHLLREFSFMHDCEWNRLADITDRFRLNKILGDVMHIYLFNSYDLVYFDPFDPAVQPELWTMEVFRKMYSVLRDDGVLVTYSSRSAVRRAMKDSGFVVEKLPGPKGKREVVRITKN